MQPMGLKLVLKVFGKGYGGDSPQCGNVIKLTESEKEAGVCLYVREQTPAITYTKMA